jgi:hypothetical protein
VVILAAPRRPASASACHAEDHRDGLQGSGLVPQGAVLERRKTMRRPMACVGVLAASLCL